MTNNNNVLSVLAGLFVGGLAGAVTMLLLAPQSGAATRGVIQEKSMEWRDHTTGMLDDAMVQMRIEQKKLTNTGRDKARELIEQGQAMVAEQLEHVSDAALSGKKAIQSV